MRKTLVRTTRTSGSEPSPPAAARSSLRPAAARSSLRPAAARSSLRPPQLSNHIELAGGRCVVGDAGHGGRVDYGAGELDPRGANISKVPPPEGFGGEIRSFVAG